MISDIAPLKPNRSTESEFPDGTEYSLAFCIRVEPKISISFFKSPDAEVRATEPRLFEQTNSAKSQLVCAPVCFLGRISYKFIS